MAANTPFFLSKESQQAVVNYVQLAQGGLAQDWTIRNYLKRMDQLYMRENDLTAAQMAARLSNRSGDKTKIQNVQVPLVGPQTESALTYLSSVFLTGTPIFAFAADVNNEDLALQYNTIMQENQTRGKWTREFMMFFRDGLKYNLHALEVEWCTEKTYSLTTDVAYQSGLQGKPSEVIWAGNRIKRMDPYNTFWDMRVAAPEVHVSGEYAGYVELKSRIALKQMIASMKDKTVINITNAFESSNGTAPTVSGSGIAGYYLPIVNPEALSNKSPQSQFDWMAWATFSNANKRISYRNTYELTTLYARILPEDFSMNVPARSTPQIWKFLIVNNQVVIFAERQTNAHNFLPIIFGQPNEDGLRYQTKSFSENIAPFQDMSSALWNAKIASARRRISDRMLYNPSMVREADINSPEPTAKIPVRNSAYGRKLEEAVYPIPFHDENSQFFIQEANAVVDMSYFASGQNRVSQGQFQKGNKTLKEFDTTMSNANGRDQTMAIFIEAQVFTDLKEMLKSNILQYQPSGDIYNTQEGTTVSIDPVALRKTALNFKVSDGLTPVDKEMNTDEFTVALQVFGASPQIAEEYNVGDMFAYLMKLKGADGLDAFKKSPLQIQYQEQLASWQQVAEAAVKADKPVPPQPQPSPALVQEMQQKSQLQKQGTTSGVSNAPSAPTAGPAGQLSSGNLPPTPTNIPAGIKPNGAAPT